MTQVAEVAVNSASSGWVKLPAAEDTGSVSRKVPARISNTKLTTITLTGAAAFFTFPKFRFVLLKYCKRLTHSLNY